jgi:hypothetical protein
VQWTIATLRDLTHTSSDGSEPRFKDYGSTIGSTPVNGADVWQELRASGEDEGYEALRPDKPVVRKSERQAEVKEQPARNQVELTIPTPMIAQFPVDAARFA